MTARLGLFLAAPTGEPFNQINEMPTAGMNSVHDFASYVLSTNPAVRLEVNTSNGSQMAGQPFVDTYYIAGAYTTRVDRFSTAAETPNISQSTDNYSRLRIIRDTPSLPTGDSNNLQYPLYLYDDNGTTQLRTMTRQDFIDSFVTPVLPRVLNNGYYDGSTGQENGGIYFLTTSTSPTNGTIVSNTPVAVNGVANLSAYTSGGIPETQKQNSNTNYYIAKCTPDPTSFDLYDPDLEFYDLQLYFNAGDETIRVHTPTSWANLLNPFLRYYTSNTGTGYTVDYNLSGSGAQVGTTYTDTRRTPTGTGYTTRFVNANDYRTQEFPTGTASTISANTKRLYVEKI